MTLKVAHIWIEGR